MKISQKEATRYYDKFSKVYDFLSPKKYYNKARNYAIKELQLKPHQVVLNIPFGTGQNLEYIQKYLFGNGLIIGVDISIGMLNKAERKIQQNGWDNVLVINEDVQNVNLSWIQEALKYTNYQGVDRIIVDLGLSGFPNWERVIDNLLEILKPGGRIVIMDWYLDSPSLRGELVKWIGKGEVDRPIWQYLNPKVQEFALNNKFNRGGVFVASGEKKAIKKD